MEFTQDKKKEVEKLLIEATIDALEAQLIQPEDLQTIAQFVLKYIDAIKTESELITFLTQLAEKWKFFLPIERFLEAEIKHEEQQVYIQKAEDLAKQGDIEEALAAIKQAEN